MRRERIPARPDSAAELYVDLRKRVLEAVAQDDEPVVEPNAPRNHDNDGENDHAEHYGKCSHRYFLKLSSTATATATVAPTIGLLPMPMRPIISTCAGTELEPANCASECMRPMVSVMP